MRNKSVGRIISTYLGCRHVPPAGMAKFLSSQSVNELSQNVSKGRRKQSDPEKTAKDTPTTIKFQSKTYTLKMEKIAPSVKRSNRGINRMLSSTIKSTLGGEMHGSDDIVDTILSMRDGVLQSLSNVPISTPEKPVLAPGDRITKLKSKTVSDSLSYVVFAKEIFSPKERMSAHDFMLEKDMVHKEQSLNILVRKYFQDGDDSLSSLDPDLEAYWKSLRPVLSDLTNAQCFNDKATHPILKYAQGFECIANYKGTPSIISIGKINTQYVPKIYRLELVAGAAAFNSDQQWPVQVENFVLILARRDGSPAIVNIFNEGNTSELWAECLMRIGKFWSESSTVKIVMERLISATMKLNSPNTMSSIDQISGKTVHEFVTNSNDANQSKITEFKVDLPKSTTGKVDQNTARSPVLSHEDVKPEIKTDTDEEKKFDLNKPVYQSNEQPKVTSPVDVSSTDKFADKKTNTQRSNAESKPEEGVLTSLWNFWKSK